MKYSLLFFFLTFASLSAVEQTEQLDKMLAMTAKSVAEEQKLREEIVDYLNCQNQAIANPENRQLAVELIKRGSALYRHIQELRDEALFSQEFLEEIALFDGMIRRKEQPEEALRALN